MNWKFERAVRTGFFPCLLQPVFVSLLGAIGKSRGSFISKCAGPAHWRRDSLIGLGLALNAAAVMAAETGLSPSAEGIARMSIEELAKIEITSVSKRPELLSDAAAAVFVITREDIRRSGATSIPEILRMAPNLQVARVDASQYAITARGFNSTTANKLLVLIDGRSVYTPLFSGVFWDVQDITDIERIEVASGPGGTLWGANAVNGVINIITRNSSETLGGGIALGAGTAERGGAAQYGGKLGDDATYRLNVKGFSRKHTVTARGSSVQDSWDKAQAVVRADWVRGGDTLMLQGAAYDGSIDQAANADKTISGAHLLARWNRRLTEDSTFQLQTYYDRTKRVYPGTYGEVLDVYDIDLQHRFQWGEKHHIVWGGGYRLSRDDVTNSTGLAFLPAQKDMTLANLFVQDSVALQENLQLTLGAKLEHNNYTGLEFQPNARLAWKLADRSLLWSAVSRALRTPSRLDRELFAPAVPPFLLAGGPNFQSEKLTAYEVGYRAQPASHASFSISAFYNVYDDLRTSEPTTANPLPIVLGNMMEGDGYGVEMWGSYRINDWWRLYAGYNYLKRSLHLKPGSRDSSTVRSGTDPEHQFSLRSTMNLPHNLELDFALRSVGGLDNPNVPGYTVVDARLGWNISKNLEVSLSGFNLGNQRHAEFGRLPGRSEFGRTFYLKTLWTF